MGRVDRRAPLRFLETAFEPRDSVAMFRKSYDTSSVAQRVGSLSWVQSGRFQRWLRAMNSRQYNLFAGRIDRVVLMLDGDDAGRQGAMSIAQTLATRMSVVPIVLDNGRQPDK